MQIKSDQDEEKLRQELKINRQNIGSQFYAAARGLEEHGRSFVKENVAITVDASIQEIDNKIHEIRSTRTNRNASCREMENLHIECQRLIRDIHAL